MRKMIFFIILSFIIGGCGFLNKSANKIDEITNTIDFKVEEARSVYVDIRSIYISKYKTYNVIVDSIYDNGNSKVWKYLQENDTQTISLLVELDKDLKKIHSEFVEIDFKIVKNYNNWQEYKIVIQKCTDNMRKLDLAIETIANITKIAINKVK